MVALFLTIIIGASYFFFIKEDNKTQTVKKVQVVSDLKQGVYKVEFDKPDFRGWRAFFSMSVDERGEIKEVVYDYVNKDGGMKTQDEKYNRAMMNKNGVGPKAYCPRFAMNLLIYQDPDKVDNITGATHSADYFKEFAKAAFKSAKQGDMTTVLLPQPELIDPNAKETK